MEIIADHTLDENGNLKGSAYSKHMTLHDMHIWYECEKVNGRCKTCGAGHHLRSAFIAGDH